MREQTYRGTVAFDFRHALKHPGLSLLAAMHLAVLLKGLSVFILFISHSGMSAADAGAGPIR